MATKNVVLVGATGTLGTQIYKACKSPSANFEVTVLTKPKSQSKQPEGVKVIRFAYDDPSLIDAPPGQDAVESAVHGMGTPSQLPLIDAAVMAGVRKFIPSEMRIHLPLSCALDVAEKEEANSQIVWK